jgi:hypothetical protein
MPWTYSHDRSSFSLPISKRAISILDELKAPGTDADRTSVLTRLQKEIDLFVRTLLLVSRSQAPLDQLRAAPELSEIGDEFVLQVGPWKAYYLVHVPTSSLYGQLVTYGRDPTDLLDRLAELQPAPR